jgi:inner membrane protein
MMGRTHALLGLNSLWLLEGAGSTLQPLNGPLPLDGGAFALCAGAAVLGALLPDLDAPNSLLQQASFAGVRPLAPLGRMLNRRLGHRGFLHSPGALGLLALITAPLTFGLAGMAGSLQGGADGWAWLSLLLGYASHLLGDACTKSGIPKSGISKRGIPSGIHSGIPLGTRSAPPPRRLHLLPPRLRLTTGSAAEEAVFALCGALALALALRHLPFANQ